MAGFRAPDEARELLSKLQLPWADGLTELLDAEDMTPAFKAMLDPDQWEANREAVLSRCAELAEEGRPFALVGHLDSHFPGDSGAATPLLLNDVQYSKGRALFVPTGQVHAYIGGFGVEVMAASDNVIRAGLTPKHVDQAGLFDSIERGSARPHVIDMGAAGGVQPPVAEFAVSTLRAGNTASGIGPRIALAVGDGGAVVGDLSLSRGQAAFIPDGETPRVERGEAWLIGAAP